MKIQNGVNNQNLGDIQSSKTKSKEAINPLLNSGNKSTADLAGSAKVNVSQTARDINKISEVARAAPDVDMNKVNKFKELINSGKYQVNAAAIADKMVEEELQIGAMSKS